jgi:5-deoxy-glucuronate isomerase
MPMSKAVRRFEPIYGAASDVSVDVRGAGSATRQINNFWAADAFPVDKPMAVEVLTPAGNFSRHLESNS